MRHNDAEQKLRLLHEAAERVSANLVELEIDSGRQLLEASSLTGQTAVHWSDASAALTELWRQHGLLTGLLEQADKLRGSRKADQLASLLSGASIELASSDVPLPERQLLGSSQVAVRCSADELLAAMSASFDEVKSVIVRIGTAWAALMPGLEEARRLLQEATGLAVELGEPDRRELDAASERLDALSAAVTADPLSVAAAELDRLIDRAKGLRDELAADAAFKCAFETSLLGARELLERLKRAVSETQAAYEELLIKISAPAGGQAPEGCERLERELNELIRGARHGQWRDLRESLERWRSRTSEALATVQRALDANRAPVAARNQLRALLEAYQVKAKRLGLLEQPAVEAIHAQARESLYNAPTDLALAAQLVRSYQDALVGTHATPETAL